MGNPRRSQQQPLRCLCGKKVLAGKEDAAACLPNFRVEEGERGGVAAQAHLA